MSWLALASARFDETVRFYGETLGFPVARGWDREGARGRVFDLGGGLKLEILDARRERRPPRLGPADDRVHVVVEVPDLDAARARLPVATPEPVETDWGARLLPLRDPDGVAVWLLQRTGAGRTPRA